MRIDALLEQGSRVAAVDAETPVEVAREAMARTGARALPVMERGGLVGMLTERGVRLAAASTVPALARHEMASISGRTTVAHVMEPVAAVVTPATSVAEVARAMATHGVDALPVVAGGAPVGAVTTHDLIEAFIDELGPAAPAGPSHVLAVVELAAADAPVLAAARSLAERHGTRVTLLCPLGSLDRLAHHGVPSEIVERVAETRGRYAADGLAGHTAAFPPGAADHQARLGDPVSAIVTAARDTGTDLILTAAPRGGRFSAARRQWRRLLREAPCPVLTLPEVA